MSDKFLRFAYIVAFLCFCGCMIASWYSDESSKEYKWELLSTSETAPTETETSADETTEVIEATEKLKKTTYTEAVTTETVKTIILEESEPLFIDINTADEEQLALLDGIGASLSKRIVRYRETNGKFNNIEEIMNVSGIGEGIFANIRDFIFVEDPIYPKSEEIHDQPVEDEQEPDVEVSEEITEEITEELTEEITEEIPEEETEETQSETEEEPTTEPPLTIDDVAPIDLNTADVEILMYLPYVDENIAAKIIELRGKIHRFSHPYELLYVEELTDAQVAEIIKYVYVDDQEE